jgi:hypothetical protein
MDGKRFVVISCIIIFLVCIIPFILFNNIEIIICHFDVNKEFAIQMILSILPLIFSIIIVIVNFMMEYIKNKKRLFNEDKNEINEIINKFNIIMTKTACNYNNLMNELVIAFSTKEILKENQILKTIIDFWENNIKENVDLTNNINFRNVLTTNIQLFIDMYSKTNLCDNSLQLLYNTDLVFNNFSCFSIYDKVFIYSLKDIIDFSKKSNNIITLYTHVFGDGAVYNRLCKELIISYNQLKGCYNYEIKNHSIDNGKLFNILYTILLKLFNYYEYILRIVFFLDEFEVELFPMFLQYYNKKKRKYKNIKKCMSHEDIRENVFLKEYINKDLLYEYYMILL